MLKYIETKEKKDCCGCRACEQICKHSALTMFVDEEGFLYPVFDQKKCTDCKLCEKVCPIANASSVLNKEGMVLAAKNNDKETLLKSSSGGIFSIIANSVLNQGGFVYGAAFDDKMILSHIRVSTAADIAPLRGSKYLQSDTRTSYSQVKKDLKEGNQVYYVGTPCQIAGLKLFLRKEYENLITSDLVCHGTPSQKIFSTIIASIEKEKRGKIIDYAFRDKNVFGWSCSSSAMYLKGTKTHHLNYDYNMQTYFNAFMKGHLTRDVCYSCPYARKERVGDITLADFWGIDRYEDIPDLKEGVSLLLLNTQKGKEWWKMHRGEFYFIKSKIEYAISYNQNLSSPTPYSEDRKKAYKMAFENYPSFVKKYVPNKYTDRLKMSTLFFLYRKKPLFNLLLSFKHFISAKKKI